MEQGGGSGDGDTWEARAAARVEPELAPARLPRELLGEVFQHAIECYPEECCGLFFGPEGRAPRRAYRCINVQSARVARGESDLDARRAFFIDELELLHALREAEQRGEQLRLVYHSHVDAAAYLSFTDLEGALGPDGEPLYPGCDQLVVSVQDAAVRDVALFSWDASARRFRGRAVE